MDAPLPTALPIYVCQICGWSHETDEGGRRRKPECWRKVNQGRRFLPLGEGGGVRRVRDKRERARRRSYSQRLSEGFWMLSDGYVPRADTPDA